MRVSVRPAPSSLTAPAPASLTKRIALAERLVLAGLVRPERHVRDHERVLDDARDRAREHQHLVERDRDRRLVPEHRHRRGVADQHDVDAGPVGEAGARGVVRRHHRDPLVRSRHLRQVAQRQPGDVGHRNSSSALD